MAIIDTDNLDGRTPCVASGFCCKRRPCAYGEQISKEDTACRFLVPWEPAPVPIGAQRYRCGKADEISRMPDADFTPAFGAGCSSSLFNPPREVIIRQLSQSGAGILHLVQLRSALAERVARERAQRAGGGAGST